ncbi:hypothetical protein [Microtetraspora malaysiensis]|uniref:hypothetical protein n=1 Tax=Microtetraspora malaysiensis TaxID=161358 RepID=UPI003D9364A7
MATATAGYLLGEVTGGVPAWALGGVALVLALVAGGFVPVRLEGSPWRVPRHWAALGTVPYAGVFGVALGTGLATALSSPGLYLVVLWPLGAPNWWLAIVPFLGVAAGRAFPLVLISARSFSRGRHPSADLRRFSRWAGRLDVAEAVILIILAVMWIGG